jgi:hypothetical protein
MPADRKRKRYTIDTGTLTIDFDTGRDKVGSMTYTLHATCVDDPKETLQISGVKQLRDDPGVDGWKDVTTLYTLVTRASAAGTQEYGGILHVPLLGVLGRQIPSIDVIGDDVSPERKTWLLAQFGKKFYRGIESLYTIGDL